MKVRKSVLKETKLGNEYLCIHFPALVDYILRPDLKMSKRPIRKVPKSQEPLLALFF